MSISFYKCVLKSGWHWFILDFMLIKRRSLKKKKVPQTFKSPMVSFVRFLKRSEADFLEHSLCIWYIFPQWNTCWQKAVLTKIKGKTVCSKLSLSNVTLMFSRSRWKILAFKDGTRRKRLLCLTCAQRRCHQWTWQPLVEVVMSTVTN